jgi:hypothetical protein
MEWEAPDVFESTVARSTDSIMDGVFASSDSGGLAWIRWWTIWTGSHRALDRRDRAEAIRRSARKDLTKIAAIERSHAAFWLCANLQIIHRGGPLSPVTAESQI